MINTRYPWYRWSDGAVKELSRCSLGEEGFLMRMASFYWKYYPTLPLDLADDLGLQPSDVEAYWTENAKTVWRFVKRYLDDQMESNLEAVKKKTASIAASKAAKAAKSREKGTPS
jgi:hypothetical protein